MLRTPPDETHRTPRSRRVLHLGGSSEVPEHDDGREDLNARVETERHKPERVRSEAGPDRDECFKAVPNGRAVLPPTPLTFQALLTFGTDLCAGWGPAFASPSSCQEGGGGTASSDPTPRCRCRRSRPPQTGAPTGGYCPSTSIRWLWATPFQGSMCLPRPTASRSTRAPTRLGQDAPEVPSRTELVDLRSGGRCRALRLVG